MKIKKFLLALMFALPLGSCTTRWDPTFELFQDSHILEIQETHNVYFCMKNVSSECHDINNYEIVIENNSSKAVVEWANESDALEKTNDDYYVNLTIYAETSGFCDMTINLKSRSFNIPKTISTGVIHFEFRAMNDYIANFYDKNGELIESNIHKKDEKIKVPQINDLDFLGWSEYTSIFNLDDEIFRDYDVDYYAIHGDSDGTDGLTYELIDSSYSVSGYKGIEYDVKIPAIYKGKYVTSINESAFSNKAIESIELPQTISSIGSSAFSNCVSLQKIIFNNCNVLVNKFENNLFSNCTSLETILVPKNVTRIEGNVFSNCSNLTILFKRENSEGLSLSNSYGKYWNPNNRPYYFNIKKLVDNESYRYAIKYDDTALLLRYYGGKVFNDTSVDGFDITYYGQNCFKDSLIEQVTISSKSTILGPNCFYGCTNLSKVTFEKESKLEEIQSSAFTNCGSLNSILIPKSVTKIEGNVFSNCNNLTILFERESKEGLSLSNSYGKYWNPGNRPYYFDVVDEPFLDLSNKLSYIEYSDGKVGILKYVSDIDSEVITIDRIDGKIVKTILPNAFKNSKVGKIILGSELENIENNAFASCENLKEVDTSRCVRLSTIGDSAFSGCKRLNYFFVRNCIEKIGKDAFKNCSNLTILFNSLDKSEINLDGYNPGKQREIFNVKNVYEKYVNVSGSIKYYVSNRNEVGIISYVGNNTTTDILGNVYESGPNTDMYFDYIDNMPVIEICDSAFYGLSDNASGKSIVNFTFGKHIKRIGKNAFCDLYSGTSRSFKIIFEDESNLETICDYAFCGNYESGVIVPKSVKKIGSYAFGRSTWLNSRTIFMEAIDKSGVELGSSWNGKQTVYWGANWTYVNGIPTPTN